MRSNIKELQVRELRITDILLLHRMYDFFSNERERFFHPGFLALRIDMRWFLAQMALCASTFRFLRRLLLKIFPFASFLPVIATYKQNEVVGFAFVKVKNACLKEVSLVSLAYAWGMITEEEALDPNRRKSKTHFPAFYPCKQRTRNKNCSR